VSSLAETERPAREVILLIIYYRVNACDVPEKYEQLSEDFVEWKKVKNRKSV